MMLSGYGCPWPGRIPVRTSHGSRRGRRYLPRPVEPVASPHRWRTHRAGSPSDPPRRCRAQQRLGTRPLSHDVDARFDGGIDAVRSADPDAVAANLEAEFGAAPPTAWRPATDDPRAWITACGDALTAAAVATLPLWSRGRPLLDREIERVGVGGVPARSRPSIPASPSPVTAWCSTIRPQESTTDYNERASSKNTDTAGKYASPTPHSAPE